MEFDLDNKIILKNVVTTISMESNYKGIQDRVVMRRWIKWKEGRIIKEKGLVLKTASVLRDENFHLTYEFIKKNELSEKDIQRYETVFHLTREKLKNINLRWSADAIDIKNRIRNFILRHYEITDDNDRVINDKKLKKMTYQELISLQIKKRVTNDYQGEKYCLIDKVDKKSLIDLDGEMNLLINLLS